MAGYTCQDLAHNTKETHPNDKAYSMGYQDGKASLTPNTREIEECLPTEEDLQKVGNHYWGGDYEPQYQELIHLKQSFKEILTPKIEKYLHQELQKAYERGVQDELNRESQNMDAVIAGMLQKAREEERKRIEKRMERGIAEFRITEETPPFYQTKEDKEATKEVRQAMRFLKKYTFEKLPDQSELDQPTV